MPRNSLFRYIPRTSRIGWTGALLALAFNGLALAAPDAQAEEKISTAGPVVVELYTSQGCSSCPPADALLAEIADHPGIIALALHVDYWDYLGWRDPFARPEFTRRQIEYRDHKDARSIYTPQIIINGEDSLPGSRTEQVLHLINKAGKIRPVSQVDIRHKNGHIEAEISPLYPAGAAVIWYVTYGNPPTQLIAAGENAGREIPYRNVVREWMKLGDWDGEHTIRVDAPMPQGADGVAVIVQSGPVGRIMGAAKLSLR